MPRSSFLNGKQLILAAFLAAALTFGFNPPGGSEVTARTAAAAVGDELYFTVLHTNDEHSALERFPRLAGVVNEIRASKHYAGEPLLLTSGGDFIANNDDLASLGGWLNLAGHAPELHFMKMIGYDVVIIGNHEFDFGHLALADMLAAAGYGEADKAPVILAANTHPPPGHPLAAPGLLNRFHLVELENGLKVGFVGLIGRDALPPYIFKGGPVEFSDPHDAAREAVRELREMGAEVIIAVSHSKPPYNRELARAVPGLDLILGGHSHKAIEPLLEGETIIFQSSSHLQNVGMLELAYDRTAERLYIRNPDSGQPYHITLDESRAPDHNALETLQYYDAEVDRLISSLTGGRYSSAGDVVAAVDFRLTRAPYRETTIGNFAADAVRLTAEQRTGERFDFAMLPSGIYWCDIGPGELSLLTLGRIPHFGTGPDRQPGHPLVAFYLTGDEIRRVMETSILVSELMGSDYYLQISGARFSYDPARAILFTLPFPVLNLGVDTPVPSTRAVISAGLYTGEGRQSDDDADYIPLKRGDRTLYRVVTESYTMYHLPTVGEVLPMLKIAPKDRHGNPLDYVDENGDIRENIILYDREGREIKSWQALVEYAASQPPGGDGIPLIPADYAEPAGRITRVRALPLLLWPAALAAALAGLAVWAVRRRIRRKKKLVG